MAGELTDLARIWRDLKHQIKEEVRYTLTLPTTAGQSQSFEIKDGGRNVLALEFGFSIVMNATGAQARVANSKESDLIQKIEVLDEDDNVYADFPNYGVAADDSTKPGNRYAQFFADDTNMIVSDAALADFGGAGNATAAYDVIFPVCLPAGRHFKVRFTMAAITTVFAANVSITSANVTLTAYTTDAAVPTWRVKNRVVPTQVGTAELSSLMTTGTYAGMLVQLVTTTEAQVSRIQIQKNKTNFLDVNAFGPLANKTAIKSAIARLTGEALIWFQAFVFDGVTSFQVTLSAGAGSIRIMSFHPEGSIDVAPASKQGAAGFQTPSASNTGGATVQTNPGAATAVVATPGAVGSGGIVAGPGAFQQLRAIARAPRR